jgi:predicted dinucleotide-binding enzyme
MNPAVNVHYSAWQTGTFTRRSALQAARCEKHVTLETLPVHRLSRSQPSTPMNIGLIGAGHIGGTAAQLFVTAGHAVALSNSRGPDTLTDQVEALGPRARAMTIDDAAAFGTVVMEAIPFGHVQDLPADALDGRILISASNYYPNRDGRIDAVEGEDALTHTELVARHADGARVVKAFNTIYWEHLRDQNDASAPVEERRVIPLAGDDAEAKAVVAQLIEDIGFAPLDLGGLREGGRRMQPGQPIYNQNWSLRAARNALGMEA